MLNSESVTAGVSVPDAVSIGAPQFCAQRWRCAYAYAWSSWLTRCRIDSAAMPPSAETSTTALLNDPKSSTATGPLAVPAREHAVRRIVRAARVIRIGGRAFGE